MDKTKQESYPGRHIITQNFNHNHCITHLHLRSKELHNKSADDTN